MTSTDDTTPGDAAPSAPSQPRQKGRREARAKRVLRPRRGQALIDTAGPDPATPLQDVRLTVGYLAGSHGVEGELKLRLTTDAPDRLQQIKQVFVGDEQTPRRLLGARLHADMALIRLAGVSTPEDAALLRGKPVRIAGSDARPLDPGEFFLYQLIGLAAYDEAGAHLGTVTDIMETGAHDVFVVTPSAGGADVLLPNHPEVVLDIRPDQGRMTVRPLVYDD